MNVKLSRAGVILLSVAVMSWPALGQSFEYSDAPYFFTDPLKTMPGVVEKGAVLPGDAAPFSCEAPPDLARPLSLSEAVDLALCNNRQIKSTWADIKIRAGSLGEARASYYPTVTATPAWTSDWIAYMSSNSPSNNTNGFTFQASATWRVFDFGGRAANTRAADSLLSAALASHDATLQRALTDVIQAYFNAMTTAATLKAKTDNEEIARNIMNSAKAREAKGAISQSDTLRATTALAKAALDKNRAYGDYQKMLAVLGNILGLSGNTTIVLPQELSEQGDAENKELGIWLEEARQKHPAIIAARKRLEATQHQETIARSAGRPTLNLVGNYYLNNRLGESVTSVSSMDTTLMVSLSIPIFDGFASTYKLRGVQAQIERTTAELADVEQQVAMGIIKAHADTTSALRNLESSAVLLDAAKSSLAVSQRKYDKGAADISEVLSTQAALSDAWQERVRCLAEWHSGRLQLLASVGQMGRFAVAK
jgi:outer membrane protein